VSSADRHTRIAIIGAGFGGIGAAIRLRGAGHRDFLVFDRGDEVGGTWRDNSYPGCACDVPSHLYSFSFAPNPDWSSTFSPQEEILDYLKNCAERFGVLPHVRFDTELEGAEWDDAEGLWRIDTSAGPMTANFLVAAQASVPSFYRAAPGRIVRTRKPAEVVREMEMLHAGRTPSRRKVTSGLQNRKS